MSNCFILLAAGKGKRFKSNTPKQFINYKNKPLFMHSIDRAIESKLFKEIVLVTNNKIKLRNIKHVALKKCCNLDVNIVLYNFLLEQNKTM